MLHHRASTGGPQSVREAVRRLNGYFTERTDLTDVLDCQIQASLIADRRQGLRMERLSQLLAGIARAANSPTMASAAVAAAAALQRALLDWNAVDGQVAVTVLTELPDSAGVNPAIASRAAEQLTTMSEKPTRALLDLLARLDKQGKSPPSRRLAELLEDDKHVRDFLYRAHDERTRVDAGYRDGAVKLLRQASPAVVHARLDEVLTACLQAKNEYLGALVLASLKSPLPRQLVEQWGRTLGTRDPVRDGVWCMACLAYDDLPDRRRDQLADVLGAYGRTLPKESFDMWQQEVVGAPGRPGRTCGSRCSRRRRRVRGSTCGVTGTATGHERKRLPRHVSGRRGARLRALARGGALRGRDRAGADHRA